jgi:hypothetical protein
VDFADDLHLHFEVAEEVEVVAVEVAQVVAVEKIVHFIILAAGLPFCRQ